MREKIGGDKIKLQKEEEKPNFASKVTGKKKPKKQTIRWGNLEGGKNWGAPKKGLILRVCGSKGGMEGSCKTGKKKEQGRRGPPLVQTRKAKFVKDLSTMVKYEEKGGTISKERKENKREGVQPRKRRKKSAQDLPGE